MYYILLGFETPLQQLTRFMIKPSTLPEKLLPGSTAAAILSTRKKVLLGYIGTIIRLTKGKLLRPFAVRHSLQSLRSHALVGELGGLVTCFRHVVTPTIHMITLLAKSP